MITKKNIIILLFIGLASAMSAQISPLADQYLLNPLLTNPAVTGTEAKGHLNLLTGKQWVGFSGAPSWQSATYNQTLRNRNLHFTSNGFVNKGENLIGNVGLGVGLFNLKTGIFSQAGIHLNYAYHIFLKHGRLSFGLAPMYHQFVIDKSGFNPPDGTVQDPLIGGMVKEVIHLFDVNAGVQFNSPSAFAGFSVVQLFNSSVKYGQISDIGFEKTFSNPYLKACYYLYGGLIRLINRQFTIEPSVIFKYCNSNELGFQLNLKSTLKNGFQAEIFYHFNESAGFMAGVNIDDLLFRYQFELPLGTAELVRFTTHQVQVGYRF